MKNRSLQETIHRFLEPFYAKPRPYIDLFIHMFSFAFYSIVIILFSQQVTGALELKDKDLFIDLIILYSGIFIVYQVYIFLIKELGWVNSYSEFTKTTFAKYLPKYITFDNNYIETIGTGKSIAIISKGSKTWGRLLDDVIMSLSYLLVGLGVTVYMLYQVSGYLLIAFIILFILSFYLGHVLNKAVISERDKRNKLDNLLSRYLVKILMSKFEILQSNKINKEITVLHKLESGKEACNRKMSTALILFFMVPEILIALSSVVIFLYLGNKYFVGEVSLSLLVGMVSSLIIIQKVLLDTMRTLKDFTKEFSEVTVLWDFFDNAPQIQGYEEGKKFTHKNGNIEIKKLDFGYNQDKQIFSNFSLKIDGEKVLALVGDSGSGKSTLVKMIAGYMRPNNGEIIVDEQNLSETSLKSYYKDIGYLTQDPSVFDGTILENLTYALEEQVGDEKIKEIILLAKCEFIYDLPKGLETEIGERGVKLSGGQKQRLAIAKIFLKDPKIIILDEPTSALDSFSEEQITKAMQNLFKNRTVIVIAHRLQTVKHADRILVLENGKIIEDGKHDELVKKDGKYAKMLELQSGF